MKAIVIAALFMLIVASAFAEIKWVDGYYRQSGTYVSGAYRDTSHDGVRENNANYLNMNRHRPEGIY